MENPFSTPSLPTMDDRQEKILEYMECLEEQAQSLAHSARATQAAIWRLFNIQNKKADVPSA